MNKHFILGQQGTSLHFIGCLIRLLYDKNYYDNEIITNEVGVYDTIFGAHVFFESLRHSHYQFRQYPEEENSIHALNCLNEIFTSGYIVDRPYRIEYDIIPAHYGNQQTINHILETFEKPKIVFIKFDNNDLGQISLNLFNKVYMSGLLNYYRDNFNAIRRIYNLCNKFPDCIIADRQRLLDISQYELMDLLNKIAEVEVIDKKFMFVPEKNDDVLVLDFGEMKNIDKLLNSLSEFTKQPVTEELYKFANAFLHNQPTPKLAMDLIKRMKDNRYTDYFYKDIVPLFNGSVSELYLKLKNDYQQ